MYDVYFLEDGGAVVGDEGFSACVTDHFIHASGSKTCANAVGDG